MNVCVMRRDEVEGYIDDHSWYNYGCLGGTLTSERQWMSSKRTFR